MPNHLLREDHHCQEFYGLYDEAEILREIADWWNSLPSSMRQGTVINAIVWRYEEEDIRVYVHWCDSGPELAAEVEDKASEQFDLEVTAGSVSRN